jgi:hypothetical protein
MTSLSKDDYELRKQMVEEFKTLSKREYEELFRILKHEHVSFTENSNGVHFDLGLVSTEIVEKLHSFLKLVRKHAQEDAERTRALNTLRQEAEAQ